MKRVLFFVVCAYALGTLFTTGCLNPLSMRRAQTLAPGEIEVLVVPEAAGYFGQGFNDFTALTGGVVPPAIPSVSASLRFGVIDKLDLQLKLDPSIIPEISLGYQLLGEKPEDIKLTVTGGIRPAIITGGGATGGVVPLPLGVLVDVPFGDAAALYAGVRATPIVVFGAGGGTGALGLQIVPGAQIGLSLKLGALVLQPEIAFDQAINLTDNIGAPPGSLGIGQFAVGLGIGGRFGGPAPTASSPGASAPPAPGPVDY